MEGFGFADVRSNKAGAGSRFGAQRDGRRPRAGQQRAGLGINPPAQLERVAVRVVRACGGERHGFAGFGGKLDDLFGAIAIEDGDGIVVG